MNLILLLWKGSHEETRRRNAKLWDYRHRSPHLIKERKYLMLLYLNVLLDISIPQMTTDQDPQGTSDDLDNHHYQGKCKPVCLLILMKWDAPFPTHLPQYRDLCLDPGKPGSLLWLVLNLLDEESYQGT